MKHFFSKLFIKRLSPYLTLIVMFVHSIVLDRNMECTCKGQRRNCWLYMVLPSFILFAMSLWADKTFETTWKYTWQFSCECPRDLKECRCCRFFCVLLYRITKAVFIGLLWVLSVLIDGNWFVCCHYDESRNENLACKPSDTITKDERAIIADMKNLSGEIGLGLLSLIFIGSLLCSCAWRRCCEECSSCCSRKLLYDQLIVEEEKTVLKTVLRAAATERLTKEIKKKISAGRWEECFSVVEQLMEKGAAPEVPEARSKEPDSDSPEDVLEERQPLQKGESNTSL